MAVETALVVDDSKSARVMLSRLLKKSGVNVAFAESAEEAFDYLNDAEPDLIFMDHMMPGMDGLHAVKLLAADARFSHIPVVMYTSKEDDGYLAKARSVGAVGVIGKPAKPALVERVLTDVNSLLGSQAKASSVPKPSVPTATQVQPVPPTVAAVAKPAAKEGGVKVPSLQPAAAQTPSRPAAVAGDTQTSQQKPAAQAGKTQQAGELGGALAKMSVSQVRSLVDTQVESILRDELQSRVAEAITARLHEVVGGIKSAIKSEVEQDQLQPLAERINAFEARSSDFSETQEHISSIYEQFSNYRDRLRDLDTKATDVEYYISELHEKFVLQQDFKDQIEEMKDYIHKEVMRQFKPLEVALKQSMQALDPENDEYQQFAVRLARDLYPVFETRIQEKLDEMSKEASPDNESEAKNNMRVISGASIMSGLSLVLSLGVTAFIVLKVL